MRKYSTTHSWLSFSLDLQKASPLFWMKLGEAQSKCDHISWVPLRPTTARELHQVYLAKGVMATTAIEGNTLSEQQVRQRMEGELILPPSQEYLGREIDNVLEACHLVVNSNLSGRLSMETIAEYNRIILQNLPLGDEVRAGTLRTHEVGVGRYKAPPAEDCSYLLDRLCTFLNEEFECKQLGEIACGLLKAIIAHLYIAWIHPFGDGNGRTARMVEFQILFASGVPSPAAHLLSNHYNATRTEYYRQLDSASRSGGNPIPFLEYALQGFINGLKEQLQIIREQQWDVAWRNYIHEKFRDKKGMTAERQRHLALDLSLKSERVPLNRIRELSPRVAQAYAGKTRVTIARDVNVLVEMGILDRNEEGLIANREVILSFLSYKYG